MAVLFAPKLNQSFRIGALKKIALKLYAKKHTIKINPKILIFFFYESYACDCWPKFYNDGT